MKYRDIQKCHWTAAYKVALAAACVVIIVPTLLAGSCAFRIGQYRDGFSRIQLWQSKETVINIMGKPSEIRNCSFLISDGNKHQPEKCVEIIFYQGIYEKWVLALDNTGDVIEKYYWFFGEYGKRPPDVN